MTFIHDLFYYGFWGMALVEFGKLALLGNALYSVFIIFCKEKKNNIKTILAGMAVTSCSSSALMLTRLHAHAGLGPVRLSLVIITFFWLCYFFLIPQIIIFLINKNLLKSEGRAEKVAASRVVLTLALTVGLTMIHVVLGQYVLGITPD